jgi:hypothetical protein
MSHTIGLLIVVSVRLDGLSATELEIEMNLKLATILPVLLDSLDHELNDPNGHDGGELGSPAERFKIARLFSC